MQINGNTIEPIIFDLGGVIIDIDIEGAFQRLKSMGIGLDHGGLDIIKNNNIFQQFETGEISPSTFRDEMRKISTNDFTDAEFDEIWNSMILGFPEKNIRFLEKIMSRYRTFLMSNTNQIHFQHFSKLLQKNYGYRALDELFEKAYFSHISHKRKPNKNFFEFILTENGLNPKTTLFIDDFIENTFEAKQLGISTIHLANGKSIPDLGIL